MPLVWNLFAPPGAVGWIAYTLYNPPLPWNLKLAEYFQLLGNIRLPI
jgi:hypothetical protein